MPDFLLAHDAGTTGVKSTLFHSDGTMEAAAFAPYPTNWREGGIAEQNPDHWWNAVCAASRELAEQAPESMRNVTAVGLSAMMNGCALVSDTGEPIRPALIHADCRSEDQCRRIASEIGEERIYRTTGSRMAPYFTVGKLAWLWENEREQVLKARWAVQTKDFIAGKLTGVWGLTDPSDASLTACFDVQKETWYEPIIASAGFPAHLLPDICASTTIVGYVTAEASRLTGIPAGAAVVAGGGDGACATAGAGAVAAGDQYHYLGGTSWVATVTTGFVPDSKMRVCAFHTLLPGQNVVYGTVQSAGSSVDWAVRTFCEDSFERLEHLAQQASPGSDGLLFLPYLSGERSPIWDSAAKGVFSGLTHAHSLKEITRSVLEGVALALAQNLKAIDEVVPATSAHRPLNALGGGMRSALWREILAATYGRELRLMVRLSEATACGAAMCAAVGTGMCSSFQEAALRFAPGGETVVPQQHWQQAMATASPKFERLYRALKPEFAVSAEPEAQQQTVDALQRRVAELEKSAAKMEELALTDELTRLPNRRAFQARILEECRRSRRYGRPLSLAILDLDNFKRINDERGHAEGDAALRTAGVALASSIRAIDLAARIGGEEFAVLFPETPQEGAEHATARIVQQLLQAGLPASAGIAQLSSAEDISDEEAANALFSQADAAMFRAKRTGGGQASV